MARVRCQIDSIRFVAACPDKLTLILKQEGAGSYVPIWLSQQGEILADQPHGRPDRENALNIFLADNNAADSDTECATLYLEGSAFLANLMLSRHHKPNEVSCPIGLALALTVRANAPILVESELFERSGAHLS